MGRSQEQWQLSLNSDLVPQPQAVEAAPAGQELDRVVPGIIAVKYVKDATEEEKAAITTAFGGAAIADVGPINWMFLKVDPGKERELVSNFQSHQGQYPGGVVKVELDYYGRSVSQLPIAQPGTRSNPTLHSVHYSSNYPHPSLPNDPDLQYQDWWFAAGMEGAWLVATGAGVRTAVIASGLDGNHPDISGKICWQLTSWDYVNPGLSFRDYTGEGTAMAGIVAAGTDNETGGAGMQKSSSACVLSLAVVGSDGTGQLSHLAQAIVYAADKVNIAVTSLTAHLYPDYLRDAINLAYEWGMTTVAATPNYSPSYPAAGDHVIAVVGVTEDGSLDENSRPAPYNDFAARTNAYTTFYYYPTGWEGYWYWRSPAVSAAIVAGAFGATLSCDLWMTHDELELRMQAGAFDWGAPGWDPSFGWGSPQVWKAAGLKPPYSLSLPVILKNRCDGGYCGGWSSPQ
jgi:hypothetical protein